ncbi:MAG: hypothetical protein K0R98_2005, partial [Rickettsiaceae bacterium]|nr:hypothetical protein [Rickettsiaceae bacterium]
MSKQKELFEALKDNNLSIAKAILVEEPDLFTKSYINQSKNEKYVNPLTFALDHCSFATAKSVCQIYKDYHNITDMAEILRDSKAFVWAIHSGNLELLQYIINSFYRNPEYKLSLEEFFTGELSYVNTFYSACMAWKKCHTDDSIAMMQYLIVLNDNIPPSKEDIIKIAKGCAYGLFENKLDNSYKLLLAYANKVGLSSKEIFPPEYNKTIGAGDIIQLAQ